MITICWPVAVRSYPVRLYFDWSDVERLAASVRLTETDSVDSSQPTRSAKCHYMPDSQEAGSSLSGFEIPHT